MIRLSCENIFCLYQKQGKCILKSVQLDIQGNCTDCIYIKVEEDMLNIIKERRIKELQDLQTSAAPDKNDNH